MFDLAAAALIVLLIGVWWASLAYLGVHLIKLLNLVTNPRRSR